MKSPKHILITGASSGLGAAIALHYARAGTVLFLQGRNTQRLETIAAQCRTLGATVHPERLDVTDQAAMQQWITSADTIAPIDLAIANAGISAGLGGGGESSKQVHRIFATNIDGVLHTLHPLIPLMLQRRHGQLAIMSSLAGIRGMPSCPAYAASKACVRSYGEGLRGWLGNQGVEVSVVCPGYIRTPMTDVNEYPMPFIMSADKAARIIAQGLERNRSRIAFPLALYIPLWLISCFSTRLTDPLFARLPAKPSTPE